MRNIIDVLRDVFSPAGKQTEGIYNKGDTIEVFVECDNCGEVIPVRLRKSSEIQQLYDDNTYGASYYVRKIVSGTGCFTKMELEIYFDKHYRPVKADVKAGKLASKDTR